MKRWRIGRGILAFLAAGAVALPLLFEIAITVAPNRIEGHPTMPVGQAAFAMFGAPVLAAIAAYFVARPG